MTEHLCGDCLRVFDLCDGDDPVCPTCRGPACDCEMCAEIVWQLRNGRRDVSILGFVAPAAAWSELTGAIWRL